MTRAPKRITNDEVQRPSVNCERSRSGRPGRRRSAEACAAQLEAVLENVDEGVVLCDADGGVLGMNRRAMEMLEYVSRDEAWHSMAEFADRFELCTPEGAPIPPAQGPLHQTVRGEPFREFRVRICNKRTGTERNVRCRGAGQR